jgi:glycosyltransferase involved in cell wall biosynthesis
MLRVRDIGALRSDAHSEVRDNGPVLGRLSLHVPRAIVGNSGAALRNARAMGVPARRLHLLPNAVDEQQFAPADGRRSQPVTLLAVGRLGPEKRFDRFLSAFARVRRESATATRAVIVGDGCERERLQRHAADLDLLPHAVEFRGTSSNLRDIYHQADVLVLTSEWEGTPNVVLEAMACGLPVVATRVGGVPEVVEDGRTGLLVDRDDDRALDAALHQLVESSSLREQFGRHGRTRVLQQHAIARLPSQLTAIYQAVLS